MTPSSRRGHRLPPSINLILVALSAGFAGLGGGCESGPDAAADPLVLAQDPASPETYRIDALGQAWEETRSGERDVMPARAVTKDMVWSRQTPEVLRLHALEALMKDESPEGEADSRRLAVLMLPIESDPRATAILSEAAGRRGWTEATDALVRSWAKPMPGVPDAQRPEGRALRALHPDRAIEDVVYGVFLDPAEDPLQSDLQLDERARRAAWELLSRLDPSGERRRELLARDLPDSVDDEGRRLVADLRAVQEGLGVLPMRGEEIDWVAGMPRDGGSWWSDASAAASGLNAAQREGLEIRHIEPLRWAAAHRPAWLGMDRGALLAELRGRLQGRDVVRRTNEDSPTQPDRPERLRDWEQTLAWGDVLAILVLDEAVRSPEAAARISELVALDRKDTTTEYGGLLEADPARPGEAGAFRVPLFAPRARDRGDDYRFVASEDMLRHSARALAHFHLHAQRDNNRRIAGPSPADLAYSASSGRHCLVLTTLSGGRANVDYYQPDGAVIDLGTIRLQ